ncbi:MAG: hypothetical protein IJ290_09100 [Bacteroidaceae bacterium]|nr:hypothetical protein [Bacteroidaceae bacterium]
MEKSNLQLSLFRGVKDTQPWPVTFDELVAMMRSDQSVRDLTDKHRYALSVGDKQSARRYKNMMLSFGIAAQFEGGRRYEHITGFTGLSLVDIDHIAPEDMERVLTLVHADEHTLLAYVTMSGHGLRILFRYAVSKTTDCTDYTDLSTDGSSTPHSSNQCNPSNPWLDNKEYRQVFEHGNEYYSNLLGIDYDPQCKNTNRISTIAYDENLYYNPEAVPFTVTIEEKKPVGRPRKVKSGKMTVESEQPDGNSHLSSVNFQLVSKVLAKVEADGLRYEEGSYNAYTSSVCYEMNRYGVPEEQCRKWAIGHFADYDSPSVEAIVHSCYQQIDEHGIYLKQRQSKANSWATIREIQDWLTGRGVQIRHNVITGKREIMVDGLGFRVESRLRDVALPDGNSLNFQPSSINHQELTDRHVNSLYRAFCLDTGKRMRINDLYIIIESDFYPEYHPLKEYLESLPAWNGIDYIDQVASMVHVTGCTQEMHNRFFKQWMVAMVAAWFEHDKTNHEILTYIGPQGIYKSTFVRHLLPTELSGYFSTKNFAGRMTKDDRLELTEMALISLEELDSLQSSELNQLKAITTDPTVNERAAYSRYKERRAHIASFCATGNNPRFLTDLTDNRRWLPFLVRDIDSPWTHPLPYTQLYAQIYTLYRTGFRYWFDADDNAELSLHNRQFEEPCIEEELVLTYLRHPAEGETGEFLTATRIIELVGQYVRMRLSPKRMAMVMNRLGFEQRRTKYSRGWIAVILTGDDIKAAQRMNVHYSRKDE